MIDDFENQDYLREWRKNKRAEMLDLRVPDRRCPCCGRVKVKSRQWVVLDHVQLTRVKRLAAEGHEKAAIVARIGAVCRSCAMSVLQLWSY